MAGDRNFDDLAHRFGQNIYQSLKGQIRLSVIERDLVEYCPDFKSGNPLSVLDAGAGTAPLAALVLSLNHNLTLVDVSVEMLKRAMANVAAQERQPEWFHGTIVQFQQQYLGPSFDVIFCHAVLEWVEAPEALLAALSVLLKPGGTLSLLFYNVDGLIYKNLLRTNFKKLHSKKWVGHRRSLTPNYPRTIEQVEAWCQDAGFHRLCHSGIRVFHDYIFNEADRTRSPQELLDMELHFSRQSPFRELGRYQHFLLSRP